MLLDEIAQLKGEVLVSRAELARHARREEVDARVRRRDQQKLESEVKRLESEMEDVKCEAVLRVAEAERATERAAVALHETVLIQEELVEEAEIEALEAREEALDERQAAREAAAELETEKYQNMLLARQVARAKFKASQLEMQVKEMSPVAHGCSADEWVSLRAAAQRKRAWRDRHALRAFLQSHPWRAEDLAVVLDEMGLLMLLFNTKEGWRIYFGKVHCLHLKLEREDFGIRFGLFLHYEMKLTLTKIQRLVEAGCKEYNVGIDRYKKKPWLVNPFNTNEKLMTPRICPARTKLEPVTKELAKNLGVEWSENGLLAFRGIEIVMQELLSRDTGKLNMPALPEFYGALRLPIIISRDATGKGSLQFTTVAACTPWASKSAEMLHIFGFGNCGDVRSGSSRLFNHNLATINDIVEAAAESRCTPIEHNGERRLILFDPHFTDDVSALRHGEHLANSGWCGCSRDCALRQVPDKPPTVTAMRKLVNGDEGGRCRELSVKERDNLSHNPPPGKSIPEPCKADGCIFAHNPFTAAAEYLELLAEEKRLAADTSKKGKQKYSTWRMKHAWKGHTPHMNVPPGLYGKPMLRHHFRRQILDALHLALLGLPKTPWKYGIKNNASDDAREQISKQLKEWRHGLDICEPRIRGACAKISGSPERRG